MLRYCKRFFSAEANYQRILQELSSSVKFDIQNRIANLPDPTPLEPTFDHAPKRYHTLTDNQKEIAIKNHLKYFTKDLHP